MPFLSQSPYLVGSGPLGPPNSTNLILVDEFVNLQAIKQDKNEILKFYYLDVKD